MESDQFDATLGGAEHLPYSANSLKFATSRSVEIAAMSESILHPSKTKLIFQTLPVHMRRRVMSHNCKRLPRKLKVGHMEQLKKSGLPPQQKRPSRKYRRRPRNLLEEYNRRKKSNVWLETHIWHAKRFHMIDRWGHRIAYSPCDKAFRACYRASSAHCLMQDVSYYIPVQITGELEKIKLKFQDITSSMCNLSIGSNAYIKGSRQGSIHLFKPGLFPCGYIGKVNYLWETGNGPLRTLWLFVHPSFIHEVKMIFDNSSSSPNEDSDVYNVPEKRQKISAVQIFPNEGIYVNFLDHNFNIFRLTGPNSHAILAKSLKCIDNIDKIKTNNWIASHFANSGSELRLDDKFQYWNGLKLASSPAQLPARIVIGLIVRDPRLSRPTQRTKAYKDNSDQIALESLISVTDFAASSPLWNMKIHQSIKDKHVSNAQFIERITKNQLIPGEIYEEDPEFQSIPVVLIQRNGSQDADYKKIGFGSGWDIILPSQYGLPFWQTFIMFGARAGGLRETESLSFEMGESYLPPDSVAGKIEEKRIEMELKEKYFRLPPSKRVNYIKLGVSSPFICHWKVLLKDWSTSSSVNDFYILRDRQLLIKVQHCIEKIQSLPQMDNASSCLVPVFIQIEKKGNLKRHALICLPKPGDVKAIKTLYEPLHEDDNENKRHLLRKEHKKSIKQSRRKREKKVDSRQLKPKKVSKQEPSEYVKRMRELWLPSTVHTVKETCSRQTLGYLLNGAFSFSQARSCGVGYIPYNALQHLLTAGHNVVLVRNVCSRKYRIAKFQIIKS